MNQKPPDRVEQWRGYFAEYRRVRDSRGEEQLLVTLRHDIVTQHDTIRPQAFSIDMDALERFASYKVPEGGYAKVLDLTKADRVEHFKGYTAFFQAGTSPEGGVSLVRLRYSKERDDGTRAVQPEMWIPHDAVKEFAAKGIDYERDLGHTKCWYPLVRVIALGESEGTGVVRTLDSVQDRGGAKERVQMDADKTVEGVLWPHPFRKPFAKGDEFTVRYDTEGGYDYGKVGIGIDRQLWKRDREGQTHVVGLWHERSCAPHPDMPVWFDTAYEHNGRPREILVFPEGVVRGSGPPHEVEYLLIERSPGQPRHGTVKGMFGGDVEKAVTQLHEAEQMHRERQRVLTEPGRELERHELPRGFRP